LEWRRKAAQLDPRSAEDALAWARCALQFNKLEIAERAVAGISEEGKNNAGYHAVAALIAQARHEDSKAEQEWEQAVQLAPSEGSYQLHLAILRANATDEARHATGETELWRLREDPKQRAAATRALILEGVAHRQDGQKLLTLARELQSYPEATFNDRVMLLDFLHQLQDGEFTSYLSGLEKSAANNVIDLAGLFSWMTHNNLNLVALDFAKSLPPDLTQQWPLPLTLAEIYGRLGDWRGLEGLTKGANWRQFDFLRHAYLARAFRAQGKPVPAEHEWSAAVKAASGQSESLVTLVRVISDWKWESETVDLLWALAKYPDKQNDALQTLYRLYARKADTQGLYRVLVRLFEFDRENRDVENNLAQVSLLLAANREEARRLAADVHQKAPSNPAYATTYAYSLLSKGDLKGALTVLNTLTADQLRDPAVRIYYGLCLASARDQRARSFLAFDENSNLLPEEKALVEKALANLNSP
jgi:thioredoxin-like negative regulator of GroEL